MGAYFCRYVVRLSTGNFVLKPKNPEKVAKEIGMDRHPPTTELKTSWNYTTLKDPPPLKPENKDWVTSIYRGIIPAKNIERRDFAIAGAIVRDVLLPLFFIPILFHSSNSSMKFTMNPGYTNEVVAHWIASYFRGDKMRLPSSSQEAFQKSEEQSVWMKIRYPDMLSWVNESFSTNLDFWT
jgi:hypothetical protein